MIDYIDLIFIDMNKSTEIICKRCYKIFKCQKDLDIHQKKKCQKIKLVSVKPFNKWDQYDKNIVPMKKNPKYVDIFDLWSY